MVFGFWSVNFIAEEIEMPFGDDKNDLPIPELQKDFIKDLKVCTLLDKPSRRKINFKPYYACFQIKDLFVVGYGLDFNERYRR